MCNEWSIILWAPSFRYTRRDQPWMARGTLPLEGQVMAAYGAHHRSRRTCVTPIWTEKKNKKEMAGAGMQLDACKKIKNKKKI